MNCKVIFHDRMKKSVNYLYDSIREDRQQMSYINNDITADSFFSMVSKTMEIRNRSNSSILSINNQIKHIVLSVHPVDNEKFETNQLDIVNDCFKYLDIDPSNHNANVFLHTDKAHSHLHVIFSKTGLDGVPMNDHQIGKRLGEFAKMMDIKHGFLRERNPKTIHFSNQLYNPTSRGELIKVMNHAAMVVDNYEAYKTLLKYHGVYLKESNKSNSLYYITKDKKVFLERNLPKPYRLENLNSTFKDLTPSDEWNHLSNIINTLLEKCETLDEVKKLFPGATIKYKVVNEYITDLTITTKTSSYHLSDFSLLKPRFEYTKKNGISNNRIIFDNVYRKQGKSNSYQEYLDSLKSKRIPLTIKIM